MGLDWIDGYPLCMILSENQKSGSSPSLLLDTGVVSESLLEVFVTAGRFSFFRVLSTLCVAGLPQLMTGVLDAFAVPMSIDSGTVTSTFLHDYQ